MTTAMSNAEYASGLRQLADWYEAHPDAPQPYEARRFDYVLLERSEVADLVRTFGGRWEKIPATDILYMERAFGPFTLRLIIDQSRVCQRIVVGYEEVPAQPARRRELVKWECGSVLEL